MPIPLPPLTSPNNSKDTDGSVFDSKIEPNEDYNDIILHIRFKETDVRLQQETLGILGVNSDLQCFL